MEGHARTAQIVDASIRSSPLWPHFVIRHLTIPIRNAADAPYAEYVDAIGNGVGPLIPIIPFIRTVTLASELIDFVFPPHVLRDPPSAVQCSIIAPTNQQVNDYNSIILDRLEGDVRTFLAADTVKEMDEVEDLGPEASRAAAILDYAARRTPWGLPAHSLTVKVGGIYRLMRNMAPERGMVKNMRCVVEEVGRRLIIIRLLRPDNGNQPDADTVLLPRIPMEARLSSGHTLIRRQFPIALAYATTLNGCQGLTLDRVGIDLTRPVFSHGQLYTWLSRVRDRRHIVARMGPDAFVTQNVTYHELLLNE